MSTELKSFVQTTLSNQDNFFVKHLIAEYGEKFMNMVRTLEINQRTIHPGLMIMAEEMLSHPYEIHHVYTFLVFCIELEKHCQVNQYAWYTHEKLVEIIVDILHEIGYTPPPTRGRGGMLGGIQCIII